VLFEPVTPHQNKTVFVIDVSGSMSSTTNVCRKDPHSGTEVCRHMSRLAVVQDELPFVIAHLPKNHEFAVVTYASAPKYFSNSWSVATPENKRAAINWVTALRAYGGTNMLKTLRDVQARLGEYDAITLLGDGDSYDCHLQACLSFCPNQQCEKPIHTTLFMPGVSELGSRGARALLKHMASETGGKFREPFSPPELS